MNCDVAIVGAGPAGLSAALVLSRCQRSTVVCDHGRPRNYAARHVNAYLGLDAPSPLMLRTIGRRQAEQYGASFIDSEVTRVCAVGDENRSAFELTLADGRRLLARKLLLATGMRDELPSIPRVEEFYGESVHHCPFCDGWEHRGKRLVAWGSGMAAARLALTLRSWSPHVAACTDGVEIPKEDQQRLTQNKIKYIPERITELRGENAQLMHVILESGESLPCDALFFSTSKAQRSTLPAMLGCEYKPSDYVQTHKKQSSGIPGLYLAGDADGDVQFAIVAAAEGAIAATAIQRELQLEDQS